MGFDENCINNLFGGLIVPSGMRIAGGTTATVVAIGASGGRPLGYT